MHRPVYQHSVRSIGLSRKPTDADELRAKIKYLISNNSFATQMGKNARRMVEEKFNADRHYSELMQVYQRAVK